MPPFVIDNSMLSAFMKCTTYGVVRYGWGLTTKGERAELISGTSAHAAVAEHFAGKDVATCMNTFAREYYPWTSTNIPEDTRDKGLQRFAWSNLATIMQQWLTSNPLHKFPFTINPEYIEVVFEVALDDNGDFILVGRIDLLPVFNVTGAYVVLDTKTTGRVDDNWARQFELSSQGSGYVFGARYGTVNGKPLNLPVHDFMVNAIQFSKLPDSDRKCDRHAMKYKECGPWHTEWGLKGPFAREEWQLMKWKADALDYAKKFKNILEQVGTDLSFANQLPQEGTFTNQCRFCELALTCLTGLNPGLMTQNLQYVPWDPRVNVKVSK